METLNLDIIFVLMFLRFNPCSAYGQGEKKLESFLIDRYDKYLTPQGPGGSPLNVTHNLQLKRIIGLDNQILSLDAYISMQWQDEHLTWNPERFGGRKMVRLPSRIIWKPDIVLENNADRDCGDRCNDINVVVTFDGTVFYIVPVKLRSYCKVDYKMASYQEVTCALRFMSWTYDGLSLNLESGPNSQIVDEFDDDFNKEWKLMSASSTRNVLVYACCEEPYIDITYNLVLKKKTGF